VREADRLAAAGDWDGLLALRDACLEATEETGRQLWGPARYAAYRVALDGPAPLAAAMVEPGVVRFGLGPLTEVVAQRHTFAELAPHLDATVLPVVAQERVLRGEDLRGDDRAAGAPDDPPLVLQPFEPAYVLPTYRPSERLDGAVPDPSEQGRGGWGPLAPAGTAATGPAEVPAVGSRAPRVLVTALEDLVAPWTAQSGGESRIVTVEGTPDAACRALLAGRSGARAAGAAGDRGAAAVDPVVDPAAVHRGPVEVAELLALLAHAGASGGVHGRRRGAAAGRSLAWWVARCATGLERSETLDPEELEFRLEDLARIAFRLPGEAAWRLEVAIGSPHGTPAGQGWAVAIAAFDRSEPDDGVAGASPDAPDAGARPDGAPW
jgi:hypothetical protein